MHLTHELNTKICRVFILNPFSSGKLGSCSPGDCKGRWQRIWFGEPVKVGHHPRVFSPPIRSTEFPINQIRIHFDHRHLTYYTEIDAVALLGRKVKTALKH